MNPATSPALQAPAPVTEQHLAILTEIGQTLSSTLELRETALSDRVTAAELLVRASPGADDGAIVGRRTIGFV